MIGTTFDSPPPDIDHPNAQDLWGLLKAGRRFRSLGSRDSYRLLRWLPMPIGDLMIEWFEQRTAASTAAPDQDSRHDARSPFGRQLAAVPLPRGLPPSRGRAIAACAWRAWCADCRDRGGGARSRRRDSDRRVVERILVADERVTGVVAGEARDFVRDGVVRLDPRSTFLSLRRPRRSGAGVCDTDTQLSSVRTVAKINLALSSLPAFRGVPEPSALAGRIHIGPELDYLERAFDCVKSRRGLDASVARHHDSVNDRHGTDAPGCPRSIDLHRVHRHSRLEGVLQDVAKDMLLNNTLVTLDAYAPGIRALVVGAEVLTPAELQKELGLSGGHMFHGELALDQLFTMRPILGHAGYAGPIRGLYLCGAGTHPRGIHDGDERTACGTSGN